jgi:CBS domain containing-hemolysin-like protein
MTANQVMIPRPDVQLIQAETSLAEARAIVIKDGHSRFPVYEQTPDNIVGTLYAKDLLAPAVDSHTSLRDMLRPVYYTPTSKPINILLREFRRERVHMAVVIDEFGGMAGIITLEDILEEIVGEIEDEYDHPIMLIKRISPDEALIDGDTSIHQLNQAMDLDLPEDKGVTINGLLLHFLAAMPKNGEQVTIGPVTITVEKATERESTSVRVKTSRMSQEEERTGNEK